MNPGPGRLFQRVEASVGARWWPPLLCSLLAALLVGRSLVDPERVFAAGEAAHCLPWRAALDPSTEVPKRPDLSDHALAFYPAYRFVSESLRAGDLPLWNPLAHAGVPCLANPQWGVLDPQVWALVGLDALGGKRAFDWGFALLAWLRLLFSALGAWLLARRLGSAPRAALLASIGYASSGFSLAWLGFSVAHVTPWLPWLLLAIERLARLRTPSAITPIAGASALALLGGHPETSFFVLLAVALWTLPLLSKDRSTGLQALFGLFLGCLLSAVLLLPFLEYLSHSAARQAHAAAHGSSGRIDWIALGAILSIVGLAGSFARLERPARWGKSAGLALGLAGALGCALALLAAQGVPESWVALLWHDAFGAPHASGGYAGPASFAEITSAWLPAPILACALAASLCRRARIARKGTLVTLGFGALALCIGLPVAADLWRFVPLLGEAATARAGAVAALCLSLLAGAGLESAGSRARWLAVAVLAGSCIFALVRPGPAPPTGAALAADASDELVRFDAPLPPVLERGELCLSGWIHPGVPAESARLVLVPVDERGVPAGEALEAPVRIDVVSDREPPPQMPADARRFVSRHLALRFLRAGNWTVEIVLERRESDGSKVVLGSRALGSTCVRRLVRPALPSLLLVAAALLCLLLPAQWRPGAWLVLALACIQALVFARAATTWTPSSAVFPRTATADFLRARAGFGRVLGGPGVLPFNTGMAHGLRGLDGYDALDVATFDAYRPYAQHPGAHPILDWNADGVDLESPAFRLLGVDHLVLSRPLDHPAWELVAGPSPEAPATAECFLYRARAPLPRAFCVARIVFRAAVLADLEHFDPQGVAFLEPAHALVLADPFRVARTAILSIENDRVRVQVELDGDGLLVLCEQAFPGWRVYVDEEEREILTVDSLFRGVVVGSGTHEVVFRYHPSSLRVGLVASLVGLLLTSGCLLMRRDRGAVLQRSRW